MPEKVSEAYAGRKPMKGSQRIQVPHVMSGPDRSITLESKFQLTNPKEYMKGGVK
jgi:hypothetical protein